MLVPFGSGCKMGSTNKTTTDWSLPSVRLPSAKKGDHVPKPAEKANPEATSKLAHQRESGNSALAALTKEDPSLKPDPGEVGKLSQIEGGSLPAWATETAPSENPSPASLAQTPSAATPSLPPEAETLQLPETLETRPATGIPDWNTTVENTLPPSLGQPSGELPATLEGGLPATLDSAPTMPAMAATPAPQMGNQPHLGNTMSELPNTLSGIPASPSTSDNVLPVSGTMPAAAPAPATPSVLFAPGNINPSYPDNPYATAPLDATGNNPLYR